MQVITAHNPDDALAKGIALLKTCGKVEDSRVGPVVVAPTPVATVYPQPRKRVSFSAIRDANPFFHLAEALWMLDGRNDLAFLEYFVPRFREFSDDGRTLNGAYGYRWRDHFGNDQLEAIAKELIKNPGTRRAVLSMWDGHEDFGSAVSGSKDVPCNTHAYFRRRGDELDMTVLCRSNDIVWGAYGANVVHFSFLLEFMAATIGVRVGTYTQVSNNYHAYIERPDTKKLFAASYDEVATHNGLPVGAPLIAPGAAGGGEFLDRLSDFMQLPSSSPRLPFFLREVAAPMLEAHSRHKAGDTSAAIGHLQLRANLDPWLVAGLAWLQRRLAKQTPAQEVRP
jgi:Thymidylate synthase